MSVKEKILQLVKVMPTGEDRASFSRDELMELATLLGVLGPRPDEPLLAARISRMPDNKDVKPADLCRVMAHDIDTGLLKADGVVLVYMWRPEEGAWDFGRYTANMTHDEELVALTLAKEKAMRAWFK